MTLFRVTSAHRILAFRVFPSQSAVKSYDSHSSHAVQASSGVYGQARDAVTPIFSCAFLPLFEFGVNLVFNHTTPLMGPTSSGIPLK